MVAIFTCRTWVKKRQSKQAIITVTGAGGCPAEGAVVRTKVNKAGRERVSVTPKSQATGENGQAIFTIKGRNKGSAIVFFKAEGSDAIAAIWVKVVD